MLVGSEEVVLIAWRGVFGLLFYLIHVIVAFWGMRLRSGNLCIWLYFLYPDFCFGSDMLLTGSYFWG